MSTLNPALESAPVALPALLYHGSAYHAQLLKPGFNHTKELVEWDHGESNRFLYATTDREAACDLGFASAIEHAFDLDHFQTDGDKLVINCSTKKLTTNDLLRLDVWIYTLAPHVEDGWLHNHNPHNSIDTEFKTAQTVRPQSVERLDLKAYLATRKVSIGYSRS